MPSCAMIAAVNLEQIQFLLGHASVQTTERYLGGKQNLGHPVNDLFEGELRGLREDKMKAIRSSAEVFSDQAAGPGF